MQIVAIVVPLLLAVAYLTYAERKVIAAMQLRQGPNVVGPARPAAADRRRAQAAGQGDHHPDRRQPGRVHRAPMITFMLALIGWAVIPFGDGLVIADINVGVLYLFAISSLGVYGIIMAGWASNSRYAFLGALRSAAQMVSYEVSIGFVIVTVLLVRRLAQSVRDRAGAAAASWFVIPLFPMFAIFIVSILAETNRHPFDLPEAESELVAGYNVEYSAMTFALFFLGEYANMILMSAISSILFLGGWLPPFDDRAVHLDPGPDLVDRSRSASSCSSSSGRARPCRATATTS